MKRRHRAAEDQERVEAAQRDLERVQAQWPAVLRAVETMREWRTRNHFAEAITATFRGDTP